MAQKDEIQYVRYYAYGSAATKLEEPERRRRERPAPKPKAERIPIPFDPVAVFGTAVAVLLILAFRPHDPKKLFVNREIPAEPAESAEPEKTEE